MTGGENHEATRHAQHCQAARQQTQASSSSSSSSPPPPPKQHHQEGSSVVSSFWKSVVSATTTALQSTEDWMPPQWSTLGRSSSNRRLRRRQRHEEVQRNVERARAHWKQLVQGEPGPALPGNRDCRLLFASSPLEATVEDGAWRLFHETMGEFYRQSSWGLDQDDKRQEWQHEHAQFILILDNQRSVKGMVHFRFESSQEEDDDVEEEEEEEVMYLYELLLAPSHQRLRWGTHLMESVLHPLARQADMKRCMLTVFCANLAARKFYQCLGYSLDGSSPQNYGRSADYEIWSRRIIS